MSGNVSLLQSDKTGHRKNEKKEFFGGCLWSTFLKKIHEKGDLETSLKQEHVLLDSGRPRHRKKGFREVPDVISTR